MLNRRSQGASGARRRLDASRVGILTTAVTSLALLCACNTERGASRGDESSSAAREKGGAPAARDWFVERAAATGLQFTHVNGMSGGYYYAEILPPGAALFDYDNDGDPDVFLVQGRPLGSKASGEQLKGRLFRNDLDIKPDG